MYGFSGSISGKAEAATGHHPLADEQASSAVTSRKPVATKQSAPQKKPPQNFTASGEETVKVTGRASLPNGVTNTTPGGGMMPPQTIAKSRSGLTRDYIAKQSPTSNAAALVASLPGVVYAGNDPLGTNDDQQGLTVRGLNQQEIGYLFEGIPAAAPVYLLPYTSAAADNENIQSLTLTQGSPDTRSPLYNAVGGELSETMRDPEHHFGGLIDATYGSFSLRRHFIRVDTGELGNSGIRGFISFSHRQADEWRGVGGTRRYHIDMKLLKEWEGGSRASFVMSYNDAKQYYLRAPTKSQWNQYGVNFNYNDTPLGSSPANYYKYEENRMKKFILGAPVNLKFDHGLSLDITPYFTYSWGYDNGGSTLSRDGSYLGPDPAGPLQVGGTNNSIVAASIDTYTLAYSGINAVMSWTKGHNTLTGGAWYSYFDQAEPQSYQAVNPDGGVPSMWGNNPILTENGSILRTYDIHLVQQTNALFINDTYKALNDKLTVTAGFKEVMVTRSQTNNVPGVTYATGQSAAEPLPQFMASYKITPHDQIYINGTASFRMPASIMTYADRYSVSTGKLSSKHASDINPEFAIGEEIGFRHSGFANVNVALFNYNFTHRQLSTTTYQNGLPISESIDAGGQTMRGAQIEVGLKRWHHFSPYFSGQYEHATIDSNLPAVASDGTAVNLPTKGKLAVNTPEFTAAVGLNYDDGSTFGGFNMNYIGKQYSTFMNDESIGGYETFNVNLGYRFRNFGFAKHPQIQLNLLNIGNNGYLSGTSSIKTNARSISVAGHSVAGSSPQYYVGGGFAGVLSFSVGF
ncbi:TonB-dependent receptor plug domain-containing protein [Acetobacter sp. LMG 1636]|uniref:TonB-dependent receptor plug domain-containing protein n=2 Tax=Acetobacter fallax TaxID=1737473 RepID=A0ABX0KFD5_9PROT|nr:TonB-dependent receptor plug domain-containing protein [Acetobacter fallax]NHO36160.1 TonB-dependent receptor plug domain-containing protein [Acetobacter fallax]